MVSLISFLLSLLAGAGGGHIAGNIIKKYDLGRTGNIVAGLVGGAIGGPLVNMIMTNPETMIGVLSNIVGSGFSGVIVMLVVGLIKKNIGAQPGHRH